MSPEAQQIAQSVAEREFQRLGGTRIINRTCGSSAATNRDLREAVRRGAFARGSLLPITRV